VQQGRDRQDQWPEMAMGSHNQDSQPQDLSPMLGLVWMANVHSKTWRSKIVAGWQSEWTAKVPWEA